MRRHLNSSRPERMFRVGLSFGLSVLLLGAFLFASAQAGSKMRSVGLKAGEGSSGSTSNSEMWDAVDEEIDLAGLWGSIDPYYDQDPFIYIESVNSQVHLFWSKWNGINYQIVHARRPAVGGWIGPELVDPDSTETANDLTPRAVVDYLGILHVSWARQDGFYSQVYHSARFSSSWSQPLLLSGSENAREPFPWIDDDRTLVDYQSAMNIVTVEVSINGYSGGSDDIDPSEVTIESTEITRNILPK